MTARVRKALVAAAAASAVFVSGCTAAGWVAEAPAAAGAQSETPARDKARNVLFVVDESGQGILAGSISTVDGVNLSGITYAPELADGSYGPESQIDFSAEVPARGVVRLEQESVTVNDPELTAGLLANVTFHLSSGDLQLLVPVYSNEHPDYEQVWESAA